MTTLPATATLVAQLIDKIEDAETGILSKVLLKTAHCQYTLFCLASGTDLAEHTSTRDAVDPCSQRV